jgi:hypothetical protein
MPRFPLRQDSLYFSEYKERETSIEQYCKWKQDVDRVSSDRIQR